MIRVNVVKPSGNVPLEYPVQDNFTVQVLREEIRDACVLQGGVLRRVGVTLIGSAILQDGDYDFVDSTNGGNYRRSSERCIDFKSIYNLSIRKSIR